MLCVLCAPSRRAARGELLVEIGEKPPFLRDVPVAELLDAKIHTADFLIAIGEAPLADAEIEADAARAVFAKLTSPDEDEPEKRNALGLLESPESVRHLVAMLTAFDWQYVEHASAIRGKLVASLAEDVDDPDPRVRHKAIELLGKVKEIALFEERSVVRRENVSDDEINARLQTLMQRAKERDKPAQPAIDIEYTEIEAGKA
jgi:HEAT repeat protein